MAGLFGRKGGRPFLCAHRGTSTVLKLTGEVTILIGAVDEFSFQGEDWEMPGHLETVTNWTTGQESRGFKLSEALVEKIAGGPGASSVAAAEQLRSQAFFALFVAVQQAEPNWNFQQVTQFVQQNATMTN